MRVLKPSCPYITSLLFCSIKYCSGFLYSFTCYFNVWRHFVCSNPNTSEAVEKTDCLREPNKGPHKNQLKCVSGYGNMLQEPGQNNINCEVNIKIGNKGTLIGCTSYSRWRHCWTRITVVLPRSSFVCRYLLMNVCFANTCCYVNVIFSDCIIVIIVSARTCLTRQVSPSTHLSFPSWNGHRI